MTNPKILIVDDEPFNIEYLEQELEDLHYETDSAVNGQDALTHVESGNPDLILLDIMMPVMDGFEVLTRLKENPDLRDIPVIVISASNDLQSVVKGIKLGAEDYLPKPFEPVLLHARIASCLEKKRLRDLQKMYLKSLEREMDIAREIQQGFLPASLPEVAGWQVAAYFKAAREVAGDFYDAYLLPDGSLVSVIGDVCGKGVGAALFMTLFRSLLRVTTSTDLLTGVQGQTIISPLQRLKQAVTFTNRYIAETHGEAGMFATIFIGLVDPRQGDLTYVNAGHEPAFLLQQGGKITHLAPTGPAVGVMQEADFSARQVAIGKGDMLIAYTDGIPDSRNEKDEMFGRENLLEILKKNGGSPSVINQILEEELCRFMGNADQFDDITLLTTQRLP